MKIELWKSVVGYETTYEVSDFGRVRRINTPCGIPRLIATQEISGGYICCRLSKNSKGTSVTIHSLVAESFIGPRPKGHQINHINGVKIDNRLENLAYVTRQENITHAIETGLMTFKKGLNHWNHKITQKHLDAINGYKNLGVSGLSISKLMHLHKNTVWRILNNDHYISKADI